MTPQAEAWARGYRGGSQTPPAPAPADMVEFCGWQAAQRQQSLNDNPFDGGSGRLATNVTFWEDANYGGASLTLPPGSWDLTQNGLGWWNDRISSLRIGAQDPQAVAVTLSDNTDRSGTEMTFRGSEGAFVGQGGGGVGPGRGLNDKVSLIKIDVGAAQQAPPPGPPPPPPPGAPPRDPRSPPPAPTYQPGQQPPIWVARTPWELWYAGWADGAARGVPRRRSEPEYLAGYQAGLDGYPDTANPYRAPVVGRGPGSVVPPPAPAPRPRWPGGQPPPDPLYYPQQNWLPPLNPSLTYEVYATLGEGALRKGVPLDLAIIGGFALPTARFLLLGNDPSDWRNGFRLSGPDGAGPRAALQKYQNPQELGLPAWVVAQRQDGSVGLIKGDWLKRTFTFGQ